MDKNFQADMLKLRKSTGLNRKEFCEQMGIPYRTVTEWELGQRTAPEYVLRLLKYYIETQKILEELNLLETIEKKRKRKK